MSHHYIDIHSHLNDPRFDIDREEVLMRMRAAKVATIVVGTDGKMSEDALSLAEAHSDVWATVGLHPTDDRKEEFNINEYRKMAAHPRVVAIGECGLDYYWPDNDRWPNGVDVEKKRQRELFEAQIALALEADKPLMIHGRPSKGNMDAYEDIIALLRAHSGTRGNIHFFVGNTDIARQFLDLGFTLSFTGVLTFTHDYDEVVRFAPLEHIMSETDAPYVAPIPYRGKQNEPAHVREVVRAIAHIRGKNEDEVKSILLENAREQFRLV